MPLAFSDDQTLSTSGNWKRQLSSSEVWIVLLDKGSVMHTDLPGQASFVSKKMLFAWWPKALKYVTLITRGCVLSIVI